MLSFVAPDIHKNSKAVLSFRAKASLCCSGSVGVFCQLIIHYSSYIRATWRNHFKEATEIAAAQSDLTLVG